MPSGISLATIPRVFPRIFHQMPPGIHKIFYKQIPPLFSLEFSSGISLKLSSRVLTRIFQRMPLEIKFWTRILTGFLPGTLLEFSQKCFKRFLNDCFQKFLKKISKEFTRNISRNSPRAFFRLLLRNFPKNFS